METRACTHWDNLQYRPYLSAMNCLWICGRFQVSGEGLREREREGGREREREGETEIGRERETDRQTDRACTRVHTK